MLLSKEVEIRWNGFTRNWYEEKGYKWTKLNDTFICRIDDVMKTSTMKVTCKCDYCGNNFEKPYRNLFREREIINKDCCSKRKCMVTKSEEVNIIKYGVTNHMKTTESQNHLSEFSRESWDVVKDSFAEKNLNLLSKSEDYKNYKSRLKFICNNHEDKGIQETNYSNVKSQKHCCKYGGIDATSDIRRVDGERVYEDFIKYGFIPKFKPSEYFKNDIPLPYICLKHEDKGIQYRQYSNLACSKGCEYCAKESRKKALRNDIKIVEQYFNKKGLILIGKYINKEEKVEYICKKHPEYVQTITYAGLKNTKCPCIYCREENNLNKLSQTVRSSLGWWRKYSKKVYKNECIFTGIKGNVEVHHQHQLVSIIKDALSNLNININDKYSGEEIVLIKNEVNKIHKENPIGVCLNKDIHILFHIKYGKKNSTIDDFHKFMDDYFKGKYDSELKEELKSKNSKRNLEEAKKLASFYYVEI